MLFTLFFRFSQITNYIIKCSQLYNLFQLLKRHYTSQAPSVAETPQANPVEVKSKNDLAGAVTKSAKLASSATLTATPVTPANNNKIAHLLAIQEQRQLLVQNSARLSEDLIKMELLENEMLNNEVAATLNNNKHSSLSILINQDSMYNNSNNNYNNNCNNSRDR